jgi:uncharacterized cupredoxin-like copper-binding protein
MWRATARQTLRWTLPCAALLCLVAVALSGCGVTGSATARSSTRMVQVTERDFRITAPKTLSAGRVTLRVNNEGPDVHELLVARVGGGAPLPLRPDGLTVDEERIQAATLGNLEPSRPGSTRELRIDLTPGRYILFCNMYGHYRGGMRTELVVN